MQYLLSECRSEFYGFSRLWKNIWKLSLDIENYWLTKMLNIGKNKAYNLLKDKSIENIKIGARYKIPKKAVIEYILKIQDEGKNHVIIE